MHLFSSISKILISVFLVSPLFQGSMSLAATNAADSNQAADMLEFASQGHVLGFSDDGVIVASARHMLKIDFLDTQGVTPQVISNVAEKNSGQAQPLSRVTYENLWEGVTAVYEANEASVVKSTYYVQATKDGTSVDRLRLGYNRPVSIDKQGNLVVAFDDGNMVESAPVAWQEVEGRKQPVQAAYTLYGQQEVGFTLSDYLPGIPVVIDPDLKWHTFLGGSGTDYVDALVIDNNGNVFVAGYSNASWGTPLRAYTSGEDAFLAKLDSSGNLIWNTFLGGKGYDESTDLDIDSSGNLYFVGAGSASWGVPLRAYTAGWEGFAVKLDSNGTIIWNTFLGGIGDDAAWAIDIDSSGNLYLAGESTATWGSPINAFTVYDAFIAKLDNNGNLIWNSFFGGSGYDTGLAIAVDSSGNSYISGYGEATWGTPIQAFEGGYDGFVVKHDSNGNLIWNTFQGGDGYDFDTGIILDKNGNIYVSGYGDAAWGTPVRAYAADYDAFAAKLDNSGNLVWNTFLGGSGTDYGMEIATDNSGNVYISGTSNDTWGAPEQAYTADFDAFAVKLDNSGNLFWHTFAGGDGTDYSSCIATDNNNNLYFGGWTTASWGTPVRAYSSGIDMFVVKFAFPVPSSSRYPLINLRLVPNLVEPVSGSSTATYTYTVTNPGPVTITDVTLTDDTCHDVKLVSGDTNGNAWLESSETWIYTCSVMLDKTTVNYATVRGVANDIATVDTAVAEVMVHAPVAPPLIHVLKKPSTFNLPLGGGSVTYSFAVTNPGTTPLANVTVIDNKCRNVSFLGGDLNDNLKLDSNETWNYVCTMQLTQTTENTALVTGEANGLTALDTDLVTVAVQGSSSGLTPLVHIIKKASPVVLPALGGTVTYTYEITNPGTVTLEKVAVTDDKCQTVKIVSGDRNQDGLLSPGETWIYTCEQKLTAATTNTATVSALAHGTPVSDMAAVNVSLSNTPVSSDGVFRRLIKLACVGKTVVNDPCRAVYYVGRDNSRHAFVNDRVFFTWYQNFDSVEIVSPSELASYPLGHNVTYRPGARLVKFNTVDKTFAVERNGLLRWVQTEDIARALYGIDWNTKVDDIPETFYRDYTLGPDIDLASQYDPAKQLETNPTID